MFNQAMQIMQKPWLEKFAQAKLALTEGAGVPQRRLVGLKHLAMEENMVWQACTNVWKLKQLLAAKS